MQTPHDQLTSNVQELAAGQGSSPRMVREVIEDLRQRLADLKGERDRVQGQYTTAQKTISELKPKADLVPGLEQEVKNLKEGLRENEAAQRPKELKEKFANIADIAAVLVEAEKRHYSSSGRNVGTTAMIGFLVSHSLSQLAMAVGTGNQKLYDAMMSNLVCMSGKLSDKGFGDAASYLQELAEPFNSNGKEREPRHRPEGPMFQFTISQLNESLRVHISPFYITVDQEGCVYRAS